MKRCGAGFTLIETACVAAVVAILLVLCTVRVRTMRAALREQACLLRTREIGRTIQFYSLDFKGLVPAIRSDNAWELRSRSAIREYCRQTSSVFYSPLWSAYAPATFQRTGLACPGMNASVRELFGESVNYKFSAAMLIDPRFLGMSANPRYLGARVQRIDDVVFPSSKALVFEHYSWHSVSDRMLSEIDIASITPAGRKHRVSVNFTDGSVESLSPLKFKPWVTLVPWPGGPLAQTLDGVRGRDR